MMYSQEGDYEKAQSLCDKLVSSSSRDARSAGRLIMGGMLCQQGKLRQALQVLDDGLAADRMERLESNMVAQKHVLKAIIYLEQKKSAPAVSEAWEACEIGKRAGVDFPVNFRDIYAYVLSRSGNLVKANEVAEGLRRGASQNDLPSMQAYWRALGSIELAKGSPSLAANYLEKGVAGLDPTYKAWRVLLGQAYLESNRLGEAVHVLEQQISVYAARSNPVFNRDAHYFLALAYEKSGWKDKAIQQYQQFLAIMKSADPGIAEVEDARARLARLKTAA
jgi:tetratricopeptide (TPR) repeat protein